jgi:hypothetical protein
LAVPAIERRYPTGTIIPVIYHYDPPFKPAGFNYTLWSAFASKADTSTTPGGSWMWVAIDGRYPRTSTPANIDAAPGRRAGTQREYDHLKPLVDARLQETPSARIDAQAQRTGAIIKVSVRVDSMTPSPNPRRLHIVLVEDEIRKMGQEGVRFQPNVVRHMAGDSASGFGLLLDTTSTASRAYTINLAKVSEMLRKANYQKEGHAWAYHWEGGKLTTQMPPETYTMNRGRLRVVVFVQDTGTGEVLDVVRIPIQVMAGSTAAR